MTDVPPPVLRDDEIRLPTGPRLALRRADGPARPFLLVHGLASNARLWDGVARRLAAAGHEVVAVDLRSHGRSEQIADGHTTARAAADLAASARALGLTGDREPISVGQSWGGNVVLTQAARHGGVAGLGLVDGGWIVLRERFDTFDACWAELAPPRFDGVRPDQLARRLRAAHPDWPTAGIAATLANFAERPDGTASPRLARGHHREILRSMWESDVRTLYRQVDVPVLLAVALSADAREAQRKGPRGAAELLPDAEVAWYDGADHDLHVQQPDRLAANLSELAARVEARRR